MTTVPETPVIAEKHYIIYENSKYYLMVPHIEKNKVGPSSNWSAGEKVDFDNVFVATPSSSIEEIN